MTKHFVLNDFKHQRLLWYIIGVLALIFLISLLAGKGLCAFAAFFAIFIVGVLGASKVFGTRARDQNLMARSFLLALPVKRSRLFQLTFFRSVIFLLPAFICFQVFSTLVLSHRAHFLGSCLALSVMSIVSFMAYLSAQIWYSMKIESLQFDAATSFHRYRRFLFDTLIFSCVMVLVLYALITIPKKPSMVFVYLPIVFLASVYQYRSARKLWVRL